jgi:hypothetical protein
VVLSHSLSMTMHGIPSLSCPIHWTQWSKIMRSMTPRYWLSSEAWRSGGITWKVLGILWRSGLTTKTWRISEWPRN